jgi:hypothetical protein
MKAILISVSILFLSRMDAISPAATYTFVDPCTPFVQTKAIGGTFGCYSFTASNGTLPGQIPGTYEWYFGDGKTGTGSVVAHCYGPETVTVVYTGTVSYNSPALCGAQPTERTFTVLVTPAPGDSCMVNSPGVLVAAQSVTVQEGIGIPEIVRSYSYGDGTGYNSSPNHTFTGCGPFVITVKSWDMNSPDHVCYAYEAVNFICKDITTGLPESDTKITRVYPNPCNEKLIIESKKTMLSVTVIDVLGNKRKATIEYADRGLSINTGNLDHGIFLVKIEYLDNTTGVFRILKN